jgi:hypothetical protein
MELREHLLYQELLCEHFTVADTVGTFEKILTDRGLLNPEHLWAETAEACGVDKDATPGPPSGRPLHGGLVRDELRRPERDAVQMRYNAQVIALLFANFTDPQVHDFINLVHKEALTRQMWRLLHNDEVDFAQVEQALDQLGRLPVGESQVSENIAVGIRVHLVSYLISDNLFYMGVAKHHITMRDINRLLTRMVGRYGPRSRVGGKSAGMILANRILRPTIGEPTGLEQHIEEVESFFLTTQVFSRFVEHNRLEEGHGLKYLDTDERDRVRSSLERRFFGGRFPRDIEERLRSLLHEVGEEPLIIRSSSLLEDSMGFPFYGKYESIFIANQGTEDERYKQLTTAIKRVYVSIFANSVIEYRRDKRLLDYDDMMSVLVQRVVGHRYGKYFFPAAAGVAFSRNQYCWSTRIRPEDGVVRIVYGLGTRAVDRAGDDYPRLVSLTNPMLRPEATISEQLKYSQRFVDVLNLETSEIESIHFIDLYNKIRSTDDPTYEPRTAVTLVSESGFVEGGFFPQQLEYQQAAISFQSFLKGGHFSGLMREALRMLEDAYQVPVDVEFAWEAGKLYVLQCRPLAGGAEGGSRVTLPAVGGDQRLLFRTTRGILRDATVERIRYLVMVDPERYHQLKAPEDRFEVARVVGRINRALAGERFVLMGPGRWGTSNPSLGVKVGYGDINNAAALIEVAYERGGYTPEVSYGTHFFQDLIEARIVPVPLYPEAPGSLLDQAFLRDAPDAAPGCCPEGELSTGPARDTVKVVDVSDGGSARLSIYLSSEESAGVGVIGA